MHKLLFDQNISYRILEYLNHLFPDSNHVRLLGLDQADDIVVWRYAKENNFHIVTKDTDFNDINALYGYPPKIIWIHAGNVSTAAIKNLFQKKYEVIATFLDDKHSGFLELSQY